MNSLQEKFQITVPAKEETKTDEMWVSMTSQRDLRGLVQFTSVSAEDMDHRKFNYMPPGMEIDNQCGSEIESMQLVISGESDVSRDTNPSAFRDGFTKREMKGTDDQYTGEHMDHFYGDSGGFVERNNYLDRE